MDIANVRAHYKPIPSHSHSNSRTQNFYDTSLSVLFDLPNAIVVSTYVLLTLVWAECFLQSRFHTESAGDWQKRWLIGYAILNSCLYLTQLILYLLIFCADFANNSLQIFRSILYIAMTTFNFIAVLLVCILYFYLSIQFAVSVSPCLGGIYKSICSLTQLDLQSRQGFPFRSVHSKRSFLKISYVFHLWSLSRIIWATGFLLIFIYDIELLEDSQAPILTPILLFLLFFFCEILPIFTMLDYSYVQIVGFEAVARRDMNSLASNQALLRNNELPNDEDCSLSAISYGPTISSLDHLSVASSRCSDMMESLDSQPLLEVT